MILKAGKILNSLSVEQFLFQLNFFSTISLNAITKNLSKKKSSENFYVMP